MMGDDYEAFLRVKLDAPAPHVGFDATVADEWLFPFQRDVVTWALRRGRAAIFAGTGLGKTRMQLAWASRVAEHTGGRVLIFAPLAVAQQTVREASAIGISCAYAASQTDACTPVVITNYDRLHLFDVSSFAGVVLDESSILKSFMGATKRALCDGATSLRFRLACTATPAPNDHLELGNHAEFLGVLSSHEMIARWFITDQSEFGTYRLKGHAVEPFWDWVASWAMCVDRPSDLGYSDDGYVLPELRIIPHTVDVDVTSDRGDMLFRVPTLTATSVHKEKRATANARAEEVARAVAAEADSQWIVWCDTDYEADALMAAMPDAVEIRGGHSPARKEEAALGFADGTIRVLISKSSIFGWGLNWQHCARVAFIGATFSYESFYQAVRRCWRFGQTRPVDVHVVLAVTESGVWSILEGKRDGHDEMRAQMSAAMRRARTLEDERKQLYRPTATMVIPQWLTSEGASA